MKKTKKEITPVDGVNTLEVIKNENTEITLINNIKNELDIRNPNSISSYAVESQTKLSNFSSGILDTVRNIDTGEIGETITKLLTDLRVVDVDRGNSLTRSLEKIPILKYLVNNIQKMVVKYDKINNNLNNITLSLDKSRLSLIKDINTLEIMYKNSIEYIGELENYIKAAEIKENELKSEIESIQFL